MFQRKYHTIIIDEKGDKRFFESLIKPYTCFVGIYVKLK